MDEDDLESLRSKWSVLYSQTLPKLARSKDAAQSTWPVTLDHCFARIILDNTVGRGEQQWDKVIEKPAIKNMDTIQLHEAIGLAEKIQLGQVDLVDLDQKSLTARGKGEKKYRNVKKRGAEDVDKSVVQMPAAKRQMSQTQGKKQSTLSFAKSSQPADDTPELLPSTKRRQVAASSANSEATSSSTSFPNPNTKELLAKIRNHAGLTPYRKRLYSTLLSVPPGSHTTYQAMAIYLDSSARAVGNGMRNNPYAPDVPCHRVLASDGSIGGFHGSWGEEGEHAGKKHLLLKTEGVRFDSKGRVRGSVFRDFEDLSRRDLT